MPGITGPRPDSKVTELVCFISEWNQFYMVLKYNEAFAVISRFKPGIVWTVLKIPDRPIHVVNCGFFNFQEWNQQFLLLFHWLHRRHFSRHQSHQTVRHYRMHARIHVPQSFQRFYTHVSPSNYKRFEFFRVKSCHYTKNNGDKSRKNLEYKSKDKTNSTSYVNSFICGHQIVTSFILDGWT